MYHSVAAVNARSEVDLRVRSVPEWDFGWKLVGMTFQGVANGHGGVLAVMTVSDGYRKEVMDKEDAVTLLSKKSRMKMMRHVMSHALIHCLS